MNSDESLSELLHSNRRSEEVKEIIERIPQKITVVLTLFLVFIVTVLVVLGFVINYPDVVSGTGTLNSTSTAIKLAMPSTGKINLIKKSKELVREGEIVAIVTNTALTADVLRLDSILTDNQILRLDSTLPDNLHLGEINAAYYQYKSFLMSYQNEIVNSLIQKNISITKGLTSEQQRSLRQLENIRETLLQTVKISKTSFQRDSTLLVGGVLSQASFEKSKELYLQSIQSFQRAEAEVINYRYSILSSSGRIDQLGVERDHKLLELKIQIINSYAILESMVHEWKRKYLITAPVAGHIEYLQFWTPSQFLQAGTEVFSILPVNSLTVLQVVVDAEGAGKVKVGQRAIVKMDDFPYMEYGTLKGRVIDISLTRIPTEEKTVALVLVELELPENVDINLKFGMRATADIIAADKRLIERLFERLKGINKYQ